MPSLKEIKTRISSVRSTRKITSAMKMVASSKLHRAQVAIQNMLPYENLLEHILKVFLASEPDALNQTSFSSVHKGVNGVALVVFSSNSSLCGAFNVNVIKMLKQVVDEYQTRGVERILVYPIGRKVAESVRKLGLKSAGDFYDLADKPNARQCQDIAEQLLKGFLSYDFDRVELIYHHFRSAGSQVLTRKQFLPIDTETEFGADNDRDLSSNIATAKAQEYLRKKKRRQVVQKDAVEPLNDNFLVEPDIPTVLGKLFPLELRLMMYTALLDSNASEHAARMVAMQTATDNADDILRDLNLQYNKSRQQAITSEILDIVGGTVNN